MAPGDQGHEFPRLWLQAVEYSVLHAHQRANAVDDPLRDHIVFQCLGKVTPY